MTRYRTSRVCKRLTDQIAACIRARYGANLIPIFRCMKTVSHRRTQRAQSGFNDFSVFSVTSVAIHPCEICCRRTDLKVENEPGAGAEIALCAPGERHSDCVEVVDEDGEVI